MPDNYFLNLCAAVTPTSQVAHVLFSWLKPEVVKGHG